MRSILLESAGVLLDVSGVRSRFFFLSPSSLRAEERLIFSGGLPLKNFSPAKVARFFGRSRRFSEATTLLVSTLNKLGKCVLLGIFNEEYYQHTHRQFSSLCVAFLCVCVWTAPLPFFFLLRVSLSDALRAREVGKCKNATHHHTWIPFRVENCNFCATTV